MSMSVCICVYTYIYVCKQKERAFKELAHMMVEAGKSEIIRVDQQAGDPEKSYVAAVESKGSLEAVFLLPRGTSVFCLNVFD